MVIACSRGMEGGWTCLPSVSQRVRSIPMFLQSSLAVLIYFIFLITLCYIPMFLQSSLAVLIYFYFLITLCYTHLYVITILCNMFGELWVEAYVVNVGEGMRLPRILRCPCDFLYDYRASVHADTVDTSSVVVTATMPSASSCQSRNRVAATRPKAKLPAMFSMAKPVAIGEE